MMVFARRLIAFMVDWVILFCIFALPPAILAIVLDRQVLSASASPLAAWAWVALTMSVPSWIYFTLSESSTSGATLGKRLFRLSTRTLDGQQVGRMRAFLRTAVKLAPWEMTHIMIFFPQPFGDDVSTTKLVLMAISNAMLIVWLVVPLLDRADHRALHDLAAGTRVVRQDA